MRMNYIRDSRVASAFATCPAGGAGSIATRRKAPEMIRPIVAYIVTIAVPRLPRR
jgi:hypothetical protein